MPSPLHNTMGQLRGAGPRAYIISTFQQDKNPLYRLIVAYYSLHYCSSLQGKDRPCRKSMPSFLQRDTMSPPAQRAVI
eukprot:scaffold37975_cov184-Skeletonema_marinoi.AAC.1